MKQFYNFKLDSVNECLWRDNQRVPLTPKAFAVLQYLLENHGLLVSQHELFEAIWPQTYVQPEVLKSHIRDIRRALGDNARKAIYVETLPRRGYRFLAPVSDPDSPVSTDRSRTQVCIGRGLDLKNLSGRLAAALRGERQMIFLTGDAGIGKSTLVDAFVFGRYAAEKRLKVARGQCIERSGAGEPYYPFLEALRQLCNGDCGRSVVRLLSSTAPTWLAQFPGLWRSAFSRAPLQPQGDLNCARMLREFCDFIEQFTAEHALILVVEDVQWADYATVELISATARRPAAAKLLLIATYRPEEACASQFSLERVRRDLRVRNLCREIQLKPFTEAETLEYLRLRAPQLVNEAAHLLHCSGGNPRFIVSLLDEWVAEASRPAGNCDSMSSFGWRIPETLRQELEIHLDEVCGSAREAVEAASVLGVAFCLPIAAEVAGLDPGPFEELAEYLVGRRIFRRGDCELLPDGTVVQQYQFRYLLYREVLYRHIPLTRRLGLHQRAERAIQRSYSNGPEERVAERSREFEQRPPASVSLATLHTV